MKAKRGAASSTLLDPLQYQLAKQLEANIREVGPCGP